MEGHKVNLDLQQSVVKHFEGGRPEAAVIVLKNAEENQIKEQAWDLVPVMCDFLTEEHVTYNQKVVRAAEEILLHLAQVANAKELLLVLLEQADTFKHDVKYKVLLTPIQQCLLRLPGKKFSSIGIALETLYAHIAQLPLPEDQLLEGKECILLEMDDDIRRATSVVSSFLSFLVPIVAEFDWKHYVTADKAIKQQKKRMAMDLVKYLLKVLNHPLGYLDLSYRTDPDASEQTAKSTSRVCAELVMKLMAQLQNNFSNTLMFILEEDIRVNQKKQEVDKLKKNAIDNSGEFDELEHYDVEEMSPPLGVCVFVYLAFGENMECDALPRVYSNKFILDISCPYVNFLLQQKENLIVFKGIELLSNLVKRLPKQCLEGDILELQDVKDLVQNLIKVMTSAKVKELSQMCVKVLKEVLVKFDLPGRNQFLFYIMKTCSHCGVIGYVTTMLKDEINNNLNLETPDISFTGKRLLRLLNMVFSLPSGEKTDLLEQSERIMAALNLLRYLVIRDKSSENITGIWDQIPLIRTKYCQLLHKGIELSRAHYQLEVKKTQEASKNKKGPNQPAMNFTVEGSPMPGMTLAEQRNVLDMAIHTFDMLESILGRVTEVIDQQRKVLRERKVLTFWIRLLVHINMINVASR